MPLALSHRMGHLIKAGLPSIGYLPFLHLTFLVSYPCEGTLMYPGLSTIWYRNSSKYHKKEYPYTFLLSTWKYRIRPNYCTYSYKRTVKQFHSLQIIASVLFVYFFIKAYVVGTYLNYIDLSMQFKWVPTTYVLIKKIKKTRINTK